MKHSILLVDDDPLILTTLQKRFETWDTDVFAAKTPEETKKFLNTNAPDVVVLDLLLTSEDGSTGILDYMKSQPRLANIPVIVLTNLDKPELRQIMLSQGVKEYLIKGSMTLDDIYAKVIQYLEPDGQS